MHRLPRALEKTVDTFWGFSLIYLLVALPTYILPLYGSNSLLAYMMGGNGFSFWLHLLALVVLIFLCRWRGKLIGKNYLVVFSQLALVFDLVPFLNFIPFAATCMHILAIVNASGKAK